VGMEVKLDVDGGAESAGSSSSSEFKCAGFQGTLERRPTTAMGWYDGAPKDMIFLFFFTT
jgi:hypothetical protein